MKESNQSMDASVQTKTKCRTCGKNIITPQSGALCHNRSLSGEERTAKLLCDSLKCPVSWNYLEYSEQLETAQPGNRPYFGHVRIRSKHSRERLCGAVDPLSLVLLVLLGCVVWVVCIGWICSASLRMWQKSSLCGTGFTPTRGTLEHFHPGIGAH